MKYKNLFQPGIESYFGQCFESLCREALPAIYRCEGVTAAFEIGEYWNKDAQIDIVGLRDDGWTDLGECKWGSIRSPQTIVDELSAKRTKYPNPRNATIALRIFTRDPVKKTCGSTRSSLARPRRALRRRKVTLPG